MSCSTDFSEGARAATLPQATPLVQPSLTVRAPGRLHLGFLDPAGSLGRRFGSLGVVINGFETEVEMSAAHSEHVSAEGPTERADIERAARCLHLLQERSGRREPVHLRLIRVLPAHAGLGSGTQLALAIGRAFAHWHGLNLATATLAQWLDRGLRSGIGIAGFDHGGLLVDGGPSADGSPAPILSRIALPEAWRVLVVLDGAYRGLSGADERDAMATLLPLAQGHAAEICHQVLMRVLPGAANAEFAAFAAGITRIQQLLGEHFAPAQGGSAYTSAAVGHLIRWIGTYCNVQRGNVQAADGREHGAAIGQSSWGPTGFAIVPSQARAEEVVHAARAANAIAPGLQVGIVSGRNIGATVIDRRL